MELLKNLFPVREEVNGNELSCYTMRFAPNQHFV